MFSVLIFLEYEHLVINGMEAQNYGVQTFGKYD